MRGLIAITVARLLILVLLMQGAMAFATMHYPHHLLQRIAVSDASASHRTAAGTQCDVDHAIQDCQDGGTHHAPGCKAEMHNCICVAAIHESHPLTAVASIAPELELTFGHLDLQISSYFPSVPRHPPITLLQNEQSFLFP